MRKKMMLDGEEFEVDVAEKDGVFVVDVDGEAHEVDVSKTMFNGFSSVLVDGQSLQVNCQKVKEGDYILTIGHDTYEVMFREAMMEAAASEGESVITAPMPGMVVAIKVGINDTVTKGQPIMILEAMKMQNEISAQMDGVIAELCVKEGDVVSIGQKLAVVESAK